MVHCRPDLAGWLTSLGHHHGRPGTVPAPAGLRCAGCWSPLGFVHSGGRKPRVLAELRVKRSKQSVETSATSRKGKYSPEHLFNLKQGVGGYEFYPSGLSIAIVQSRLSLPRPFQLQKVPTHHRLNGPLRHLMQRIRRLEKVFQEILIRKHRTVTWLCFCAGTFIAPSGR